MGFPAVLTGNRISSICTLTASSEDLAHPLGKLYDRLYADVFMFGSAGPGWLQIDFTQPIDFDTLFIGNHNFAATTTLVVKAGNVDPPVTVLSAPAYRARAIWKDVGSISARYLRLEHNDPGTPYIGELIPYTRTLLPRSYRYGQIPGKVRADIYHETQAGVAYAYGLFEREARDWVFRITEDELATFEALDTAVKGRIRPFVLIPDVSQASCYYVRFDEGDFRPQELQDPLDPAGFEVAFKCREEATGTLLAG